MFQRELQSTLGADYMDRTQRSRNTGKKECMIVEVTTKRAVRLTFPLLFQNKLSEQRAVNESTSVKCFGEKAKKWRSVMTGTILIAMLGFMLLSSSLSVMTVSCYCGLCVSSLTDSIRFLVRVAW